MALDDPTLAILTALEDVRAGRWDEAHAIAQRHEGHSVANWLHAVLHKIEGDETNSRYWYARSGLIDYERFADPEDELRAIFRKLTRDG